MYINIPVKLLHVTLKYEYRNIIIETSKPTHHIHVLLPDMCKSLIEKNQENMSIWSTGKWNLYEK